MSRLTRMYIRMPRPSSMLGLVSLQTGTELISLALVFNKVTGIYGLLAILTGYQLSLLQLSTYVYSIAVLAVLAYLIPHIRRQSAFECLTLAWVYTLDTGINAAYTAAFGLEWYFASTAAAAGTTAESDLKAGNIPSIVAGGLEGLRQETAMHGKVVPQETAFSMLLIVAVTLVRVYFSVVVIGFAQQTMQKHIQLLVLEGPGVDERDGPFAPDMPGGEGRRGQLGRLMVSFGRRYWLTPTENEHWASDQFRKPGTGSLAGEV